MWVELLAVVVSVLCLSVVALAGLSFQLLRHQGRLMLRVEELGALGGVEAEAERPRGLAVGTSVPKVAMVDVDDVKVSLSDFLGRRVLLVHWDPRCGFCADVAEVLAESLEGLHAQRTELVLLSHGDVVENRRLATDAGLSCPILLDAGTGPVPVFGTLGTPAAYLLDDRGRVAKPLALGSAEVATLSRSAARRHRLASERPLSASRIERKGLAAGSRAPEFALPTVDGGTAALADHRGRRVLLVFSDPACGPCEALAPELADLSRRHSESFDLLLVSRGGVEQNRAKAREHGVEFPVAIQPGWSVSKAYGMFDTPVAFLIGPDGVIERDVARGAAEIHALARAALPHLKEVATIS